MASEFDLRKVLRLSQHDPAYPVSQGCPTGGGSGEIGSRELVALGNLELLRRRKLGFFCSVRCPGELILHSYDLAQRLRESSLAVVGGFHTPMEKECLKVLLKGPGAVILCPARSLQGMRVPGEYREPLEKGRLLLLSPFPEGEDRVTAETALVRNRFVAALADALLVPYAEPGGKTEQLCREAVAWGKPLYTLESERNGHLAALGAYCGYPGDILGWCGDAPSPASWPGL